MQDIRFRAAFGNTDRDVQLFQPMGAGHDCYHLLVDNYFWGTLSKYNEEWVFNSNKPVLETAADILILGEIIENSRL